MSDQRGKRTTKAELFAVALKLHMLHNEPFVWTFNELLELCRKPDEEPVRNNSEACRLKSHKARWSPWSSQTGERY